MSESKRREQALTSILEGVNAIADPNQAAFMMAGYRLGVSPAATSPEVRAALDAMVARTGLNAALRSATH